MSDNEPVTRRRDAALRVVSSFVRFVDLAYDQGTRLVDVLDRWADIAERHASAAERQAKALEQLTGTGEDDAVE